MGKNKLGISASEYNQMKNKALEQAPIRSIVNVADISIHGDDIYINDQPIAFSADGVRDMAVALGIPYTFIKKYESTFGVEGRNHLINQIAAGLGSKRNKNLMLIGSPVTKSVIAVKSATHKYVSNEGLFKLIDDTMNDNPGLVITSAYSDMMGKVRVDAINPEKQFNLGTTSFGKHDEDFHAGVNFIQSPGGGGTSISQYVFRMLCDNGMIWGIGDVVLPGGGGAGDAEAIKNLYLKIRELSKTGFMPENMAKNIAEADKTDASYAELELALRNMPKDIMVRDKFLPYRHIMADLRQRGIQPWELNPMQRKNCRVACSVYDVVNAMTDIASHDYQMGFNPMDNLFIQGQAQRLLAKKSFDTKNLVK